MSLNLSKNARALLDEASSQYEPSRGDADRVLAKLAPKIIAAAAVTTGAATVAKTAAASAPAVGTMASTATATATVGLGTKIVAGIALASAVGMGAMQYVDVATPARAPAPIAAPAVMPAKASTTARPIAPIVQTATKADEAPATNIEEVIVDDVPATPRIAPARAVTTSEPAKPAMATMPSTTTSAPTPSTLGEELSLLRQSETQLRSGDPTGALATLDAHATRYPNGVLVEERMAGRVFALCALGRVPEARASADALFASRPNSPHVARVRASCITK